MLKIYSKAYPRNCRKSLQLKSSNSFYILEANFFPFVFLKDQSHKLNYVVVTKQAMFLIAKTSLWSNGLAGLHPTPRLILVSWHSQVFP